MTVIATGGDGDGYGIGLNHFIQAMRRNINLTYIVMNNEIYGLTTGQVSPTSETGMMTKTSPHGNLEQMLNPMALALASGCGYIARGFSGQPKHLMKLYQDGIQYPGFALIDVFSPCVTFNKVQHLRLVPQTGLQAGRDRPRSDELPRRDGQGPGMGRENPIGLLYRNPNPPPSLHEQDPGLQSGGVLVRQPLGMSREQRRKCIEEFM